MVGIEYNRLKMHQYFWRLPEIAGNGTVAWKTDVQKCRYLRTKVLSKIQT